MTIQAWRDFQPGRWMQEIDVRDFIQKNYSPYDGDETFLSDCSEKTKQLWQVCRELLRRELESGGVLSVDPDTPLNITSHPPGYIDHDLEVIVGLQTTAPLERGIQVYGGLRHAIRACEAYGYELNTTVRDFFDKHRRTHNEGVFTAYTPGMKLARKAGIITGLPDSYGRGRIIGDYRRVSLYGVNRLIEAKELDREQLIHTMSDDNIRLREELFDQIEALKELKTMAQSYGYDISRPAENAHEAVQWLYFAYLASIKEQNGAAMSLGRIATFLDIYIERDLKEDTINETEAQELIDQLVIKLRLVRHLRTPEYSDLFAGDPNWVTEAIGGAGVDGRHLVTKNSYRLLHTLTNLEASPEPNMTILWSQHLPLTFQQYCARLSIKTSALQYENDDLMRPWFGDDYAIACCVSAMRLGSESQYFGARCNLAKLLLYALNGGQDEITGQQVGPNTPVYEGEYLEYDQVMELLQRHLEWLTELYVNTMNLIHYMHDRYSYERIQLALHDTHLKHYIAFGIAGLSVIADSLSAIKYTRVKPIKDERGIIVDFELEGDYPKFGNDDDRVDEIAVELVKNFIMLLEKHPAYKGAVHTLSILTITSNVMYGHHTGATPDGRKTGQPLAPGANPLHGREEKGAIAAANSVAKLPYSHALDGISYTFSIVPSALGKNETEQTDNLVAFLKGYFSQEAHHINVNVINIETLRAAMENPQAYPDLTIRVSGYAVHFIKLSREQQEEIIARTFYQRL